MQKKIAVLLVTLSAIFWGTNFNIGKFVIEQISPLTTAAIRFSLASLFIIPMILCLESKTVIKETIKRNLWVYVILGVIGVAGFNALIFIGLKQTSSINGALIMATNPMVTLLLSRIFLKNSINATQQIGLVLSLVGVIAVITHGSLDVLFHLKIATGDWIIMGGNLCWASYGVFGRRFLNDSKPLITTAATMVVGAIALLLFASAEVNITQLLHQTGQVYISLFYMAIFGSVLAYLFWNYGITHVGAGNTSVFFNLVPVVTVLVAVIFGQSITPVQIIGGLIVISGVLLSTNIVNLSALNVFWKRTYQTYFKSTTDAVIDLE